MKVEQHVAHRYDATNICSNINYEWFLGTKFGVLGLTGISVTMTGWQMSLTVPSIHLIQGKFVSIYLQWNNYGFYVEIHYGHRSL